MRSGKIADINDKFIADCQIFDRTDKGARLRLARVIDLPEKIRLFDDEKNVLLTAVVVWTQGMQIGVMFPQGPGMIETSGPGHAALSGKFYAL